MTIRVRDLIRQIAAGRELEIVSGKVARDHVHVLVAYRPDQRVRQIAQWLKGIGSRVLLQEVPHLRKKFWVITSGRALPQSHSHARKSELNPSGSVSAEFYDLYYKDLKPAPYDPNHG